MYFQKMTNTCIRKCRNLYQPLSLAFSAVPVDLTGGAFGRCGGGGLAGGPEGRCGGFGRDPG